MSVTYTSLFMNLEPCKVGTSILLSSVYPEREDATNELRARLGLTQMGEGACICNEKQNKWPITHAEGSGEPVDRLMGCTGDPLAPAIRGTRLVKSKLTLK